MPEDVETFTLVMSIDDIEHPGLQEFMGGVFQDDDVFETDPQDLTSNSEIT